MATSSTSAPSASSKISVMTRLYKRAARFWAGAVAAALAGCGSSPPPSPPAPPPSRTPAAPASPEAAAALARSPSAIPAAFGEPIVRARSRWWPVEWDELPGWQADRVGDAWPALLRGCRRPSAGWESFCAEARAAGTLAEDDLRAWLKHRLQPYRIESPDGAAVGLATGYYEPLLEAQRAPRGDYQVPLYALPADRATRRPYWSRRELDTLPEARASLRGRELAFVANPLDALILQVQGSGRLQLTEPDGRRRLVRMAFAGHNDQPYRSIGGWLVQQGELRAGQSGLPAIRAWAERNPGRVQELVWSNPRVVFFREEPLADPTVGPPGAVGVPLTPGRSIAIDPQSVPYGTPVWIDTTEPLSSAPLRRLVVAQDTGSAITGAVRADYFWGWGDEAEQQAGRMKQPLRLWALWPRR